VRSGVGKRYPQQALSIAASNQIPSVHFSVLGGAPRRHFRELWFCVTVHLVPRRSNNAILRPPCAAPWRWVFEKKSFGKKEKKRIGIAGLVVIRWVKILAAMPVPVSYLRSALRFLRTAWPGAPAPQRKGTAAACATPPFAAQFRNRVYLANDLWSVQFRDGGDAISPHHRHRDVENRTRIPFSPPERITNRFFTGEYDGMSMVFASWPAAGGFAPSAFKLQSRRRTGPSVGHPTVKQVLFSSKSHQLTPTFSRLFNRPAGRGGPRKNAASIRPRARGCVLPDGRQNSPTDVAHKPVAGGPGKRYRGGPRLLPFWLAFGFFL